MCTNRSIFVLLQPNNSYLNPHSTVRSVFILFFQRNWKMADVIVVVVVCIACHHIPQTRIHTHWLVYAFRNVEWTELYLSLCTAKKNETNEITRWNTDTHTHFSDWERVKLRLICLLYQDRVVCLTYCAFEKRLSFRMLSIYFLPSTHAHTSIDSQWVDQQREKNTKILRSHTLRSRKVRCSNVCDQIHSILLSFYVTYLHIMMNRLQRIRLQMMCTGTRV